MSNFLRYYRNRFGFERSFLFAFGMTFRDAVIRATLLILAGAALAGLASAVIGYGIKDAKAEVQAQSGYVKTLETWLANCMSPYYEFQVGDEKWMCGAAMRWEPKGE